MTENQQHTSERAIDLVVLMRKIWLSRTLILKLTIAAMILGIVVAFATPRRYTTKVLLAPESAESTAGIASAASMLGLSGINIGAEQDALSVALYPDIVASTPFMIELLKTPVQRLCGGEITPLSVYLQCNKERRDTTAIELFRLTKVQAQLISTLRRNCVTSVDKKSGLTTIAVTFCDPQVSAMVATQITKQLQRYVTTYRTSKAEQELRYWEQLHNIRQQEYYQAQQRYADYVDANRNVVLQSVLNERERLQNEKMFAHQLYTTVATQMQMARAKVEEAKPLFVIIEPATVPLKASNIGRITMVVRFALGGVVVALLWIFFGREFLTEIKKSLSL